MWFWSRLLLLGAELIPSLIVASALTATSVGVSVSVWKEQKALNSPQGELLLDVAELDDLTGVILMALLFALLPLVHGYSDRALLPVLARSTFTFLGKLLLFAVFCFLFARYAEKHLTRFLSRHASRTVLMLVVVGFGIVIAAGAGLIGFSVAIGAFFAGLIFSRDPKAVKIEASFESLYDLFMPFFFIGIGLSIEPGSFFGGMSLAAVLVAAAAIGKFAGVGGVSAFLVEPRGAVLLGLSMIPRAEIAMIIMHQGARQGSWAVPPQIFSAMVVVSALTCAAAPLVLHRLLRRWPPQ